MKTIKFSFFGFILVLTGAWLLADTLIPEPFTYFTFRSVFVQYSGVIAISAMSLAMILALRSHWIERPLDGLDKMYRLHKWLGITALVVAVLHWWWVKGTKWMVGWGWLTKPERKSQGEQMLSSFEQLMRSQRDFSESAGKWAFYGMVILLILALVKRFPYHLFRKTHNWLAIAYLALAYHTLILTKLSYWFQPIGWVLAVLLLGGTLSALIVLTGRVGHGRKAQGVIESLEYYPGMKFLVGKLSVNSDWKGHTPGQFAFVTSSKREGAHPYTIASAWDPDNPSMMFIAKGMGDWTNNLRNWLKVGMPVTIEGPYGCFDFNDHCPRQIWIGGGVGITPFIARMKYLAKVPGKQVIDLFYVTSDYDQTAIDKLTAGAEAAGVRLHLVVTPKDGRLTPEQVRTVVPEWCSAGFWYCGPNALSNALRKDLKAHGMPSKNFHQELFEMR